MTGRGQGRPSVRPGAAKGRHARAGEQTRKFEKLLRRHHDQGERYILRLYVAGTTPRSIRAVGNIRRLCQECLAGRCDFRVVDIYQLPETTRQNGIIAAPTLVKQLPLPVRRLIGDFSDRDRLLAALDLADAIAAGGTRRP